MTFGELYQAAETKTHQEISEMLETGDLTFFDKINNCKKLSDLQVLAKKESNQRDLNFLDVFCLVDKAFDLGSSGRIFGFISRR